MPWFFLLTAFIPGHLFDWAVEWAFATSITVLGIFTLRRFHAQFPQASRFGLLTTIFISYVSLVAYTGTLAVSSLPTGARDVVDLLKPCMVFFSCSFALSRGANSLYEIRRACFVILCFAVSAGLILMFSVPVLSDLVNVVYGSTKTAFSEFLVRLSIPFENPNFLGLLAVLSLLIALNFDRQPDIKLAIVSLMAAALSGSRTAWVTAFFTLVLFLLRMLAGIVTLRIRMRRAIPIIALTALVSVVLVPLGSERIESYQRLSDFVEVMTTFDLASDESYAERIALRNHATDLISQRPIAGWGAMKYSTLDIVDSQYYGFVLRFGILGSLALFLYVIWLFTRTIHALKGTGYRSQAAWMWLVLAVWLWNGSFLENIRMAILIVLILASITRIHARSTN